MEKNEFMVSIITPSFNSCRFILDAYSSLCRQTYSNWEWVVTDDCSSDDTVSILKGIAEKDNRVKVLFNKKNEGSAFSRNRSIEASKGRFLAFIDSDDVWDSEKLDKQISFMAEEDIAISFTSYTLINERGDDLDKVVDIDVPGVITYRDLLAKKVTMGCSTVMLDRKKVKNIRMPLLRTGQDYATWLSILKEGHKAYLFRVPLSKYRIVSGSISRNKFKKAMRQWEIYRDIEGISFFLSLFYFASYAKNAIFRK